MRREPDSIRCVPRSALRRWPRSRTLPRSMKRSHCWTRSKMLWRSRSWPSSGSNGRSWTQPHGWRPCSMPQTPDRRHSQIAAWRNTSGPVRRPSRPRRSRHGQCAHTRARGISGGHALGSAEAGAVGGRPLGYRRPNGAYSRRRRTPCSRSSSRSASSWPTPSGPGTAGHYSSSRHKSASSRWRKKKRCWCPETDPATRGARQPSFTITVAVKIHGHPAHQWRGAGKWGGVADRRPCDQRFRAAAGAHARRHRHRSANPARPSTPRPRVSSHTPGGDGQLTEIDHGGGVTAYAHKSQIGGGLGQQVQAGAAQDPRNYLP